MKKEYYSEISHQQLFSLFDSCKKRKTDVYRKHNHTELELGFIRQGTGTYLLKDQAFDARPGDLFIVRSNEQHCVPTITSDSLSAFNIHISPYYLWNICSDYVSGSTIQALIHSDIPIAHQVSGSEEIDRLSRQLQTLHHEIDDRRFEIRSTMIELIRAVGKTIGYTAHTPVLSSARLTDIQKAISYIESNYDKPMTLDDIARTAAMSRSYLANTFKLITGISPYEYLLTIRIEKAVEALRNSDQDVMTIALECGFSSTASFNKIFKKNIGITPSELRKTRQNI